MSEQEAIAILGGDENSVEEFVTEKVFSLKTSLLRGVIIPSVFRKKAEKMSLVADSLVTLGFEDENYGKTIEDPVLRSNKLIDLLEFYRTYETILSSLKLDLMQAFHPRIISKIIERLAHLEHQRLIRLAENFEHTELDPNVKLSDFINTGEIIAEIKNHLKLDKVEVGEIQNGTELKKEISKSLKYYNFVRSKEN